MDYRGYNIQNFSGRLVIFDPEGVVFQAGQFDIFTEEDNSYGAIQCCKMIDALITERQTPKRTHSDVIIDAYNNIPDYAGNVHSKVAAIRALCDHDHSLGLREAKEMVESVLDC